MRNLSTKCQTMVASKQNHLDPVGQNLYFTSLLRSSPYSSDLEPAQLWTNSNVLDIEPVHCTRLTVHLAVCAGAIFYCLLKELTVIFSGCITFSHVSGHSRMKYPDNQEFTSVVVKENSKRTTWVLLCRICHSSTMLSCMCN